MAYNLHQCQACNLSWRSKVKRGWNKAPTVRTRGPQECPRCNPRNTGYIKGRQLTAQPNRATVTASCNGGRHHDPSNTGA